MKAEYKREQGRTWVLFEGADSRMAGMEMLRRNKIPGLASFYEEWEDNCWHYGYEITGAQPLALLLEFRPLTEEMVRILILQVAELFQKLEQYLLEPDGIILDPEFLYLEPDHLRCRFFYCPDQPGNWKDHIRELIWLFLGQAPETEPGLIRVLLRLCRESRKPEWGQEGFCSAMELIGNGWEEADNQVGAGGRFWEEPKVFDEKENRLESECEKQNRYTIAEPHEVYYAEQKSGSLRRKRKRTGNSIVQWLRGMGKRERQGQMERHNWEQNRENEWAEEPSGKEEQPTEVLYVEEQGDFPVLYCKERQETVTLETFPFYIGSQAGTQYDPGRNGISRLHAVIDRKDGKYWIQDLNSTNGTWLNGQGLLPHESRVIQNGDRIVMAELDYEFRAFDRIGDSW